MLTKIIRNRFSSLFTWGETSFGWCRPVTTPIRAPYPVPDFPDVNKVSTGQYHIAFLTNDHTVYTAGYGKDFRLGLNSEKTVEQPTKLTFEGLGKAQIVDVKCGARHNLALADNGSVYQWGYVPQEEPDEDGEMFVGDKYLKVPTKIDPALFGNNKIVAIGAGEDYSIAFDSNGKAYGWGQNVALLNLSQESLSPAPIQPINDLIENKHTKIVKFFAIKKFFIGLAANGHIYTLGENSEGIFGTRKNPYVKTDNINNLATKVYDELFKDEKIVDFQCSSNSMIFITQKGRVFYTGMHAQFQPAPFPHSAPAAKLFATKQAVGIITPDNKVLFINDKIIDDSDHLNGQRKVYISQDDNLTGKISTIGGSYYLRYALVD